MDSGTGKVRGLEWSGRPLPAGLGSSQFPSCFHCSRMCSVGQQRRAQILCRYPFTCGSPTCWQSRALQRRLIVIPDSCFLLDSIMYALV
jgi:hypothetical protein